MVKKYCSKCKQEKIRDDFYNCKSQPDGKSQHCRECQDKVHNAYIASHRRKWNDYTNARHRAYYAKDWGEALVHALDKGSINLHRLKEFNFSVHAYKEGLRKGEIVVQWARKVPNSKYTPYYKPKKPKCGGLDDSDLKELSRNQIKVLSHVVNIAKHHARTNQIISIRHDTGVTGELALKYERE